MKADPILEELWRVKDEFSRQFIADTEGYFARQEQRMRDDEKAGHVFIHSAAELHGFTHQHEAASLVARETGPKYGCKKPDARRPD